MKREINTLFCTYHQNNSGGTFYRNDVVREILIVEGLDTCHAEQRAEQICENYSSWCECCGPRWSFDHPSDAEDGPTIWGVSAQDWIAAQPCYSCIVHYLDGTTEIYEEVD